QPFSSAFFGPDLNTYLTAGMRLGFYCTGNSFDSDVTADSNPHIEVASTDDLTPGLTITSHASYVVDGTARTLTLRSATSGMTEDFSSANTTAVASSDGGEIRYTEALVYSRVLTVGERQAVEAYLAGRYGITLAP